jgi:hypothetical protein
LENNACLERFTRRETRTCHNESRTLTWLTLNYTSSTTGPMQSSA